jgi:hypothetical protein
MDNKSKTAGRKRDGPVAPGAVFDRPLNRSDESRGPQLMRVGQLPENNEDPRASTSPPPAHCGSSSSLCRCGAAVLSGNEPKWGAAVAAALAVALSLHGLLGR